LECIHTRTCSVCVCRSFLKNIVSICICSPLY
jgi:hypothetical protein